MKLLFADDDRDLLDMLRYIFQRDGYSVVTSLDGEAALRSHRLERPDLIVLDLNMPKRSGMEVLQEIRRESRVPVIALTCMGDEGHMVSALEKGADDYVAKPFRPSELKARVKAVLRRSREWMGEDIRERGPLLMGDISLNTKTMEVRVSGRSVRLTRKEFSLLQYLMVNSDRIMASSDILAHVWGYDGEQSDESLRTTIARLRRKIEPDPSNPTFIVNVSGMGYRFVYSRASA